MTTVEPEWDQATRDLVVALDGVPVCGVCGRDPAVCQDPERQDDWIGREPVRCHATTALLQRQDRAGDLPHARALLWPVELLNPLAPRQSDETQ